MNLKFVTFNLRSGWDDGINTFIHRVGSIIEKIDAEQPDIIAFQEYMPAYKDFFKNHLTEYDFVGHGRNEDLGGEGVAVAYKRNSFTLMGYDSFWLSPTPYKPGSRYEDQSHCPRICAGVTLLHNQYPTPIRVYTVHLDHKGVGARVLGVKQILEKAYEDKTKIDYPCIIAGDFNALPDEETIKLCNEHPSLPLEEITKDIPGTFHNFGKYIAEGKENKKIDYIFTDKFLAEKVKDVYMWDDEKHGVYLSDHYPVCAVFDL